MNYGSVIFDEIKITFNGIVYTFTGEDNTNSGGLGVDNTVGYIDAHQASGSSYPRTRFYTGIVSS